MLSSNGPKNLKINRDVSNFIVTLVLERRDDLIKNSYRRLTTENVARNEHWAKIAEIVSEKFEIPAEMERVKSHFHNRKKVLLARIKEELRVVNNAAIMSTDEKLEVIGRRTQLGEYDEQLARVCLDVEEEEKGRTEQVALGDSCMMFAETKHESLLTQLLNSTTPAFQPLRESSAAVESPLASGSSRESDTAALSSPNIAAAPSRAPLLCKLLTDPSTSADNAEKTRPKPPSLATSSVQNRRRPAAIPMDQYYQSPSYQSPNPQYLSHLIVDVTSPQELKKLLSVLIDNGFSRFQHVASLDAARPAPAPESIRRLSKIDSVPRAVERPMQELVAEDYTEKAAMEPEGAAYFQEDVSYRSRLPTEEMEFVKDIQKRVEHVEVKVEPIDYDVEDEGEEEEMDEHTAEFEAQLSSEAIKNGLALFEKAPSPKKQRLAKGEIVEDACRLCGTTLRLNAGGSKWNFYEHVIMKHSAYKPFKCPHCPYQTGRKVRVRNHCIYQHHQEADPIDITTPEIRSEWLKTMSQCFPDHQYGKNVSYPYEFDDQNTGGMPKFVVIELNDDASTIDLLSYCVKKNFDRISILNRLEDHPYLRDDQDVVVQDDPQPEDGMLLQLNDEERQRLVKMISNPGPQTLNIQMPSGQNQHLLQQHPSTSAYNSSFIYIKSDEQYKESTPSSSDQFDATVNSVAHGGAGMSTLEMFSCNGSPNSEVLRRKTPNRKAEDSMKATCKLCHHEVMYSPQRTWNLMRHVWIMHPSTKPNQCSICGYSHIKPYVRKHIDSQHKHDANARIIDLKSPELELEWSALLERCFGVTYRKWKHHKEDPAQHPSGILGYDEDELSK